MKKEIFKKAFVKSLPIMCSYLFVSMAYGIMMEEAGFGWYDSLFISVTVYTGAFQNNTLWGQGTYTWPDGRTYTGYFEDGLIVQADTNTSAPQE